MMSDFKSKISTIGILMILIGALTFTTINGRLSVVAAGATIYVDDDNVIGPWDGTFDNPYQNITSGLANASNGDFVYVRDGIYSESVVVDKSVALVGVLNPVVNGTGGFGWRGIEITADNVTVEGFNITNCHYGIYCTASGFSIIDNIFWYNDRGFYWRISEMGLAEDYTVYDGTIEHNEFYMSTNNEAVYVSLALNYPSTGFYEVSIGDISIGNNTFYLTGTSATGIDVDDFYVEYLYGGSITIGTFNISGNTIYGGNEGIDF